MFYDIRIVSRISTEILCSQSRSENFEINNEDILIVMKTDSSVKSWKLKQSNHTEKYRRQYEATIRKTTAENETIRITAYSKLFQHVGYNITIRLVNKTKQITILQFFFKFVK